MEYGEIFQNFTNWKVANEPQPNQDGDCLRIIGITDDNALGQWNDWNCAEIQYFICKMAAGINLRACESDWVEFPSCAVTWQTSLPLLIEFNESTLWRS